MKLKDFDYCLPEHLIAQKPLSKREDSRLLKMDRNTGDIEFTVMEDIERYLTSGDVLVLNETRVIPARLKAFKQHTKGKLEIFLLKDLGNNLWEVLVKPGKKAQIGNVFLLEHNSVPCHIISKTKEGGRIVKFDYDGNFYDYLESNGKIPLPSYIKREPDVMDKERYQTVFGVKKGAVAAPTAGLHFSQKLLNSLEQKGIKLAKVLLHVGLGTFRPVSVENIEDHQMHTEYFEIYPETVEIIKEAKMNNKKIIAVGTTSVRALESSSQNSEGLIPCCGETDIFIYPGYKFKLVDGLITNFHLPKSSLLMLVSAFAGCENIKKSYSLAIENEFRFFSYGDAMIIL